MTLKTTYVSRDGTEHNSSSKARAYALERATALFETALTRVENIPTRLARANHLVYDPHTRQLIQEGFEWTADATIPNTTEE